MSVFYITYNCNESKSYAVFLRNELKTKNYLQINLIEN